MYPEIWKPIMKPFVFTLSLFAIIIAPVAQAHPDPTPESQAEAALDSETNSTEADALKAYGEKMKQRMEAANAQSGKALDSFSKSFDTDVSLSDPESIRQVAKELQNFVADSGVIVNFANLLADFAKDMDVVNSDTGVALKLDGATVGKIETQLDNQDGFSIEALGKQMTIAKQTVTENGEQKTRLILEMDSPTAKRTTPAEKVPEPSGPSNF